MLRKRRLFLANILVHIVQRDRSREPVFFDYGDCSTHLHWLKEASQRYDCGLHAYVLMTNHIHILATPNRDEGLSKMMQYLGLRYEP